MRLRARRGKVKAGAEAMGIYKIKGSPYFQYDFTVKGFRHRGSTETDSRKQALEICAKLRSQELMEGHYPKAEQLRLTEAFARYELERAQFLASYPSIKAQIDHMLAHFGEHTPLHTIGQAELAGYVAKCRTETYTRTGWKVSKLTSPATINRRLSAFQGMHNDARLTWGAQVKNIDFSRLMLDEPPPVDNTFTPALLRQWLDTCQEHVRHFTMLAVFTGLRADNILTLTGPQIDVDRRIIETIGKGNKKTTVPIVDELLRYIVANKLHLQARVITYQGKGVKSIKTSWNTTADKLGAKGVRRHDLRHTCGTWIYENTGDLLLVKEMLHHADIRTSLRYTHTNKDSQRAKVNKALSPKLRQSGVKRVK